MLRRALIAILPALAACSVGSQKDYEPAQPIAYSHALHAGEFQIDCTYCHYGAERGRHAGIPPTSVCMNCHSEVKKDSPLLQPVRDAMQGGDPIEWVRVHRLPDFAFFDHSSHVVTGGVKCQTCHGPVETMTRVRQVETMSMGWCVDCHRTTAQTSGGKVVPPTDCSACHF